MATQSSKAKATVSGSNNPHTTRGMDAWSSQQLGALDNTLFMNPGLRVQWNHGKCLGSKFSDVPKTTDPLKPCQLQECPQKWGDCRSTLMWHIRAARQLQVVTWLLLKCDRFVIRGHSWFWSDFLTLGKWWSICFFLIFCVL